MYTELSAEDCYTCIQTSATSSIIVCVLYLPSNRELPLAGLTADLRYMYMSQNEI